MTTRAEPSADTQPLWDGGWYRDATRLESPNHGPRPAHAASAIDLIVVHSISLPPGEYGGLAVQQLFTNTLDWDAHPYFDSIRGLQVSAHFFVDRTGALWQFVDCDLRAWHAGQSAYRGRTQCKTGDAPYRLQRGGAHPALVHQRVERFQMPLFLLGHMFDGFDAMLRAPAALQHGKLALIDPHGAIFAGMIDADHGFDVGAGSRRGGLGFAGHCLFSSNRPTAAAASEKMAL